MVHSSSRQTPNTDASRASASVAHANYLQDRMFCSNIVFIQIFHNFFPWAFLTLLWKNGMVHFYGIQISHLIIKHIINTFPFSSHERFGNKWLCDATNLRFVGLYALVPAKPCLDCSHQYMQKDLALQWLLVLYYNKCMYYLNRWSKGDWTISNSICNQDMKVPEFFQTATRCPPLTSLISSLYGCSKFTSMSQETLQ